MGLVPSSSVACLLLSIILSFAAAGGLRGGVGKPLQVQLPTIHPTTSHPHNLFTKVVQTGQTTKKTKKKCRMTAVEGPVRRHGIRLVAASPTFHRAKAALSESKSGAFSVQKLPFRKAKAARSACKSGPFSL